MINFKCTKVLRASYIKTESKIASINLKHMTTVLLNYISRSKTQILPKRLAN